MSFKSKSEQRDARAEPSGVHGLVDLRNRHDKRRARRALIGPAKLRAAQLLIHPRAAATRFSQGMFVIPPPSTSIHLHPPPSTSIHLHPPPSTSIHLQASQYCGGSAESGGSSDKPGSSEPFDSQLVLAADETERRRVRSVSRCPPAAKT
ncbi:hypothetical protein EYF80_022235 [Liparis tanakae]|uniref:Uncharacterized protein n=1 Tax=Liparis tanakae TaxID=230148 RepID=A0A4Z2HRY1_9TELE|nr:hypothetical protein EYF80_022235 [Liparis tanakae]